MVINWKIHRRRRLIFAFFGLLFGIWFVQNAIAKCGIALLIHDNPPGTPLSKAETYAASRGWFQVVSPIIMIILLNSTCLFMAHGHQG